jgi:hypothetical protein
MKIEPIPTRAHLNSGALARWLAAGDCPVILTDVMGDWPAMQRWSFAHFSNEFGDFPIIAHAPQFPALAHWGVKTTLRKYIAYLDDPEGIDGEWIAGDLTGLQSSGLTLYAGNFNPAHPIHGDPDRVFVDVPATPSFIESWQNLLNARFVQSCNSAQSHHFVYLSIRGGVTPLHHDFWDTHAFLAQIVGTKRAMLFHPKYMNELYSEPTGDASLMLTNPTYSHVTCWSAELSPGQMLIIPSRWLHWVETLSPSITYSADWIDGSNWRRYVDEGSRSLGAKGLWP